MHRVKRKMAKNQKVKTNSYIRRGLLKCPLCRKGMMKVKKEFFEGDVVYIRNLDFMGHGLPKTFKKIPCHHCGSFFSLDCILSSNTRTVKNTVLDVLIFALVMLVAAGLYSIFK